MRNSRGISQELHEIPTEELDKILQYFFAELVKSDGTDYEPQSLRVVIACLDRNLREHRVSHSLLKNKCFEKSRKVLEWKAVELRRHGKGNK